MNLNDHLSVISEIKKGLSVKPARLINLTISGAHLYGFESEDSDIDYRGTFLIHTSKLLGLHRHEDVFDLKIDGPKLIEVSLFEMRKEIGLALSGNCNVLEHINAPQIVSSAESVKLKRLINNSFGKLGLYNSYKGMATFNYKKFILGGRNNAKKYLYVFRGLLAGIYVLQTGEIEPNIEILNRTFKIDEVKRLIELKKQGMEKGPVPADLDTGILETRINELFERIDKAFERSKIPDRPSPEDVEKINEFLLETRKGYLS